MIINPYIYGRSLLYTDLFAVYKAENNANDSLGVYNGTSVGGLTYVTGKSGNAFNFNGTTSYVTLGDNLDLRTSSWSYNVWLKFQNVANTQFVASKTISAAENQRFAIGLTADGSKLYTFINFNGTDLVCKGGTTVVPSVWMMATYVIDRLGSLQIYFNSVQETISGSSPIISSYSAVDMNSTRPFRIGSGTASDGSSIAVPFSGQYDELSVWNRALTSAEITELYNTGLGKFYPY